MRKIPVIIDTDPGIDDALAITMLAGSDKVDIKALTTTHGNVGLEGTSKNALALKDFLGIDCIVAKGAAKPMIVPLKNASEVHGENGLAGYELPAPTSEFSPLPAWDVMYNLAKERGGEMTVLVLGPMTNLAIAILKYPDLKKYIKRVYMMGGSRAWGNHSPNAEFNIWGDPHACQVVLHSEIPITMRDLYFGHDHEISGAQLKAMYAKAKKLKPMVDTFFTHDMKWIKREEERVGHAIDVDSCGFAIFDATAAAALILDGESLETEDYFVMCETQSVLNEGQTVFDYKGAYGKKPNVQLAVKMDIDSYIKLLTDALEHFE